MKNAVLSFLVSTKGSILAPLVTAIVAWFVAQLATASPDLAKGIDQAAVAGWLVASVVTILNFYTNKAQTAGVEAIQSAAKEVQKARPDLATGQLAVRVDGVPGPVTMATVTDFLKKLKG